MAPYLDSSTTFPSASSYSSSDEGQHSALGRDSAAIPIAICGIALRLPGGIATPSQFWDFLVNKQDARGPIPETRFKASSFYSKSGKPGFIKSQYGYFLDESVDLGALDTSFFSIPKNEVERADPQQRLLLELARECFESAGETAYRGKAIGAYVGSFGEDWAEIFGKDPHVFGLYKLTGQADFVLSNRISYEYDLRGPSMTLRTGCSSALIGLHEACLAIRNGECNAALVGGCNLIMAPGLTVNMSEQGVLSPDGSCKTFDADANGYARGEAINLIYIKKLSDALGDGNPIRAVIRGTSINADGKTTGITVPSYVSHEAMIRRAYSVAGLNDISETAFVECHGTGTPTGDPIEITAIANVFGDKGVFIGSVKPNVGHSEGASGITSLIKSVLALEHQIIPPNIKFYKPNPKIPFEKKKLRVPTEPVSWPKERRERVSVNSFGIGGANAHVILESTNSFLGTAVTTTNAVSPSNLHPQLLTFSANTADSLRRQVVSHEQYITEHPEAVVDIAYTLGARRVHLPHRAYTIIGDGIQFTASPLTKASSPVPEIVMIFTGQGAQWPQMGAELLHSNASFKAAIRKMDKMLHSLPDGPSWSIMDELLKPGDETNLHKASISQPLCTAVQVALVDALANVGIRPYAVIGHSSGEMAAAYAAGKLSANEAITYAYYRGVASSEASKPGSMAAVGMGWEEASEFLAPGAVIACENSPSSVTISGDKSSVEDVLATIRDAKPGMLVRELKVDRAYHSHHMKEVGDRYRSLASRYMCHGPFLVPNSALFFSSVTGTQLSASDPVDTRYWQANLESPVLFRTATAKLLEHHKAHSATGLVFLEVGPHSALAGPLRQTLAHMSLNSPYASCLIRSKNATQTFLAAIGQLWLQGISPDFNQLTDPTGTARVVPDLPPYPWQHDHSLLFETRITKEWRFQKFPKHELLGVRVPESTDNEPVFRNVFLLDHAPWVRDHNIKGDVIFPCAGYVGMAGEAARQLCDCNFVGFNLRNVVIDTAMILNETKPIEIVTSLRRERLTDSLDSSWLVFTVSSHNGSTWIRHCTGQVQALSSCGISTGVATTTLPRSVNVSKWYRTLRGVGANYGPYFQGLKNVSCSTTEYISAGTALHTVHDDEVFYPIHPTKIDFFLQLFAVAVPKGLGHKLDKMTLPTFIEEMEVFNCDTEIDMAVSATPTTRGLICGGGQGLGLDGRLVLKTRGVKLSPLDSDTSENTDPHAGARIFWQPDVDFLDISILTQPHVDQQKYMQCCEELNRLCIQEALRRLEDVVTEVPHLQQFHAWMRMQPSPTTNSTIASLLGRISLTAMAPIAAAVTKVLNSIVPIFEGNVEPLDVLAQDDTLTKLYDCLNLTDRTKLFKSLGHAKPNLKILEIGAGTGGTTNAVLASLVNDATGTLMYGHYTYTDISAGFFAAAKERFEGYPNMTFKVLDISKDPLFQSFESESYDLIIGANVLHATPSLQVTLANVRKLLHPEGRLYLEELCSDVKPFNFIMGILPGWWLGAGDDRLDEPYVPPERWDKDLREAGFSGLDGVTLDCPQPNHLLALMTAKPAVDVPKERAATILYDNSCLDIAEQLESYLNSEKYVVSLHNLADQVYPTDKDIIAVVDLNRPFFEDIDSSTFNTFRSFVVKLSQSQAGVLWLTGSSQLLCTDPSWAQVIGTARTIRNELSIDLATCEIDKLGSQTWQTVAKIFERFQKRRNGDTLLPEYEYAIVDGVVHIPRLFPVVVNDELKSEQEENEAVEYDLTIGKYGRLNTLRWTPRPSRELIGEEVVVDTKAVGMNFKDVLIAMGIIDSNISSLGLEAAGIVRQVGPEVQDLSVGDRVFVLGGGSFSTGLLTSEKLCARIPDCLGFEDAATMPCVFSTVIYGLLDVGRLGAGQAVLIHSACGGVGLAAIQICKMAGAEIYCTVSNDDKIQYLESSFGIPRTRIFNSRDASFLADIMRATNGRGVDLVLNSLSGELLHASWNSVAEFGKMIEIGKRDLIGNGKLALNVFELNRSYHGVDLGHLIELKPTEAKRLLKEITHLYELGHIQPIRPLQTFTADAVEDCFRCMQKGQHIGKIVVSMETSQGQSLVISSPTKAPSFDAHKSYLLVGGLGGLGRVVSNWMVEHGARHLVFLSRSAGESDEDRTFLEEIRSQGCSAIAVKGSVTALRDVKTAISAAPTPIRGVLNMSMVLGDQIFSTMSYEEWTAAVEPKVKGTWNLHNACLLKGLDLDFFVLFSSISGIYGQRGQANYAGANTFLDSFVQYRQSLGLKAGSIDIGLITDQGAMAENPMLADRLIAQGNFGIRTSQLLDALSVVISMPASKTGRGGGVVHPATLVIGLRSVMPLDDPSNRIVWKSDRRMCAYYNDGSASSNSVSKAPATSDALADFLSSVIANPAVLNAPNTTVFIAKQIGLQLSTLLLRPVEDDSEADVSRSLQEIGLDSLVAIEMRNWWKGAFEFDISVLEILSMGSLLALGERAVEGLKGRFGENESRENGEGQVVFSVHQILETKMP